jgi:2-polyprenyl-3-methyl-5-hydroxy-6-metoxy-1,4-benzoquinol methylase
MKNQNKLYEKYTSTSSLVDGIDEQGTINWSINYFQANYMSELPTDKDAKILEVGCGYGRYIAALSSMGYKNCIGIDLSAEQINYAKTVLGVSSVEQADALEWLADKDSTFDCILGIDILEHFKTDELLRLGELIFRALKKEGVAIFQVPNGMAPLNPITFGDLTHERAFTPTSMRQFLLAVGLKPVSFREIPPYTHGVKSAIKRLLWSFLCKPLISFFVLCTHGAVFGGHIYTANFAVCAKKV